MTLRRVGGRLACAKAADADKTSGSTATRGSSYTARPLPLPGYLYSFARIAHQSPGTKNEADGEGQQRPVGQ